jgi:hypothetical protein
MLISA